MRHTAWLQAAPHKPGAGGADAQPPIPRIQRMRNNRGDAAWQPPMPPVHAGQHLLDWFWEVGPAQSGGAAAAPIGQQELAAWQANTGIHLQAWQARCLRSLSVAYVNAAHEAQSPDAPPPWRPRESSPEQLTTVAHDMRAALARKANL